jgi:Protein of unknown function (DUF1064)
MTYFVKKSYQKFHNARTEYNGRIYRSKFEASYAQELDLRVKSGELISWEYEKKIEFNLAPDPNHNDRYYLTTQPMLSHDGERL